LKLSHRRQFLHLAAGAAALPALSRFAWAQAYPTRPVRLIEGFGAGGAADVVARLIGQSLSERLGQSFVIENRSGAASNIAAEAVVRASPDQLARSQTPAGHSASHARLCPLDRRADPVADFVTGIKPAYSPALAWPGSTAPPGPAHPVGRSVEHPGSGIIRSPGGTRGTSGRHRCSGKDRRRRK
jgi:Tripartite tricarboxylate transporter family receptor